MFNNIALDVSIGLIFIFLIYSLLATIIQEMLARMISLRGRMLVRSIRVMLEDRHDVTPNIPVIKYIGRYFISIKNSITDFYCPFPQESLAKKFYQHPTIKYLSESTWHNKPAYIGPVNFSDTMIRLLRGSAFTGQQGQMTAIQTTLDSWDEALNIKIQEKKANRDISKNAIIKEIGSITVKLDDDDNIIIGVETFQQIKQLFIDAQGDIGRFRALLEKWFDHTMDRTNGWYKRQTQSILLLIGLFIAFSFNVDTISIYHVLAKDKKAREAMVQIAISSQPKYQAITDSLKKKHKTVTISATVYDTVKKDSVTVRTITDSVFIDASDKYLDTTYKSLVQDAAAADKILGMGKSYCDKIDSLTDVRDSKLKSGCCDTSAIYPLNREISALKRHTQKLQFAPAQKGGWTTFFGWMITALAISLGAPFWFDLLNKLIFIRSAGKKSDNPDNGASPNSSNTSTPVNPAPSPLQRKG